MKINVMCAGCEVTVEEVDGKCIVIATQDGEVVEEFSIDCEEGNEEGSEEIEELDMDDDMEEGDSDMEEGDDDDDDDLNESVKSFNQFFKK